MIKVTRTYNRQAIKTIALDESIIQSISHDYFNGSNWEPNLDVGEWYLVYDDFNLIGYFLLVPYTELIYEFHVGFKDHKGGKKGTEAFNQLEKHILINTPVTNLIGFVSEKNRAALLSSARHGFKQLGSIHKGRKRNGEFEDLVIVIKEL